MYNGSTSFLAFSAVRHSIATEGTPLQQSANQQDPTLFNIASRTFRSRTFRTIKFVHFSPFPPHICPLKILEVKSALFGTLVGVKPPLEVRFICLPGLDASGVKCAQRYQICERVVRA
jgi:hypothetical protein